VLQHCSTCGKQLQQDTENQNLFTCADGHQNWVNPITGCCAYILDGDKVLYGVPSGDFRDGGLDIPGGILEVGETFEQCVVRECEEEMGVTIRILDYVGSYATKYGARPITNVVFAAEIASGTVKPSDDMNGGEPVWRSMDDLPRDDELQWDWQYQAQRDLAAWYKSRG